MDTERLRNALTALETCGSLDWQHYADELVSACRDSLPALLDAASCEELAKQQVIETSKMAGDLRLERDAALAALETARGHATKITAIVDSYNWLVEGRGPYEHDDDRYRAEAGHALSAIRAAARAWLEGGEHGND